jgi:hypothetical protein
MNFDLSCYGSQIANVADLVGDCDLRSPTEVHAWYRLEWEAMASVLGFTQQLAATLPSRAASSPVAALQAAGLEAYARALRHASKQPESQSRTQSSVLQQMVAAGRERGELWRVSVDPTTLPTGACYEADGQALRAFYPDTAPGYFGEGWAGPRPRAASACGWQTPLVLHLGTFPWVYSSRLDATGPGMRWTSASAQPAVSGLQLAASLMEPATNLRQDARQVAAIFNHFDTHTQPLLARLPVFQAGRAEAGRLYRRGGFLYVHQGSLHVAALDGPRGNLPAPAYNHILRRFACFFAIRRATLRALAFLPAGVRELAMTSNDPCLREQATASRRAG